MVGMPRLRQLRIKPGMRDRGRVKYTVVSTICYLVTSYSFTCLVVTNQLKLVLICNGVW